MLAFVLGRASTRKLRLFACASARQLWEFFRDERSRKSIEVSERFADGLAAEMERQQAWEAADAAREDAPWFATRQAVAAAWAAVQDISAGAGRIIGDVTRVFARQAALEASRQSSRRVAGAHEQATRAARLKLCELAREVFGNPFRDPALLAAALGTDSGAVERIARVIYTEGTFEVMPILADALEDAGCQDEEILAHCREEREHVRGCWALDAILGQE
jgi:hypothetical protein